MGSLSWVKGDLAGLSENERARLRAKQGLAMPLIELRLIGGDGTEQPWDGKAVGEVQIRGPWVASTYYKDERPGEQWPPGEELTKEEILEFLQDKVAKWRLPDDVVFLEEIPKTSVGKFSKKELRAQFEDYKLPTA